MSFKTRIPERRESHELLFDRRSGNHYTRTLSFVILSQLTQGIHPMLFQCGASVEDGGANNETALGECPVFARIATKRAYMP